MSFDNNEFDRSGVVRKAIREGYIPIIELVGILAEDVSYINVLPILYNKVLPRLGFPRQMDFNTFGDRHHCWMTIIRRWGGMEDNPALKKRMPSIKYLNCYYRDKINNGDFIIFDRRVQLPDCINQNHFINLDEFSEYLKNIEFDFQVSIPCPEFLFLRNHYAKIDKSKKLRITNSFKQRITRKSQTEESFDAGAYFDSIHTNEKKDSSMCHRPLNRKNNPLVPIVRNKAKEKALWIKHIEPILQKHDLKNDSGDRFEYRFFEKQINEKDVFEMLRRTMWLCRDIRFPKAGVSADVTNDFFGGADDFFLEIVRRLRDSDKGEQIFIKKDGVKIDLRDTFRDFLVSLFENKTLPEFLELFQRKYPLTKTEAELILTENIKTDTLLKTNLKPLGKGNSKHDYSWLYESIERAHQTGYIELDNLVWVMAIDDSYDEIILQLLKKYQCDKRLPEERNRHDMWTRLLRRWSRVGFDEVSVMSGNRRLLPAIQLIPHYQYKTGTFIKKEPIFFDDYSGSGVSYIKLDEFKEYLTRCIKIVLPASLFTIKSDSTVAEIEKPKNQLKEPNEVNTLLKTDSERSFSLDGDFWTVRFDGKKTILKALQRVRYVISLLENPDRCFAPTMLTTLVRGDALQSNNDLSKMKTVRLEDEGLSLVDLPLDGLSKEDKDRLEDSAIKVYEEYRNKDSDKNRNNWEITKNFLSKEYGIICLEFPNGLRFKVHRKSDRQSENARSNISKNIKNCIADLKQNLPELAKHLEKYIKTGHQVRYEPEETAPPWTIRR